MLLQASILLQLSSDIVQTITFFLAALRGGFLLPFNSLMLPQFLHVGCGTKTALATPFAGLPWKEVRCDINPDTRPDLIGTVTNMNVVESGSMDGLYSSHTIQPLSR